MAKIKISALFFLCALCGFAEGEYILTYRGLMINNSSSRARKVFEGISIDDYSIKSVASGTNPKYMGNYTYLHGSGRLDYLPISESRYEKNGKKCLDTVLQTYRKQEGNYNIYQYRVTLEQRGADVYGYLSSVCVCDSIWLVGRDLSLLSDCFNVKEGGLAYDMEDIDGPNAYYKAYGVDCITLRRNAGPFVSESVEAYVEGNLSVPSNVGYVADGTSALAESEYAGKIDVDGTLTIRNPGVKKFSGAISGDGDLFVEATSRVLDVVADVEHNRDFFLEGKWKIVAEDRLLSSLTNVTAILCGSRVGGDKTPAAYGYWRNNGAYAAMQVYNNVANAWQTGCLLRMRQNGRNIEASIASYSYDNPWENGFNKNTYKYGDIDFEAMASKCKGMSIPTSRNEDGSYADRGQVGLHSPKFYFAEGSVPHIAVFTGKNSMETGSVVRVSGTDKAIMVAEFSGDALPAYGELVVDGGGRVFFSGQVDISRLTVNSGGSVWQGASQCLRPSSTHGVHLNGGTMVIGYYNERNSVMENYSDAGLYLNYMHFENGAKLLGSAPRVGYGMNPRWYVTGAVPSVCATGMSLFPAKDAAPSAIVMEVEDVTGNAEADFRITNPIRLFYPVGNADFEAYKSAYIRKEGPGTVSMEAAYTPYQPTVIAGGTWRFSHSKSASESTDFKLAGGNLEIADGIALTMGEVIPSVASTITLGEGASLSIKAPTADWPEDGSVNFVVSDIASRSSIRFGESASLSAAHLGAIRVNGKIAAQNSAGYLRPVAFRVIVR